MRPVKACAQDERFLSLAKIDKLYHEHGRPQKFFQEGQGRDVAYDTM